MDVKCNNSLNENWDNSRRNSQKKLKKIFSIGRNGSKCYGNHLYSKVPPRTCAFFVPKTLSASYERNPCTGKTVKFSKFSDVSKKNFPVPGKFSKPWRPTRSSKSAVLGGGGGLYWPKLRPKIFLWPNLKNSWFYSGIKKKVSKFSEKLQKMPKFLKFKCGFLAEIGRYLAGKWPIESDLPKILAKIFFITKSQKFVILSRKVDPPPPPFFAKNGGGGSSVLYDLSQISFKLIPWPQKKIICFFFFGGGGSTFFLREVYIWATEFILTANLL